MANWYKTGTVDVTNASTSVTGSGTLWLVETAAGDMFTRDGATWYEVAAVNSNTSLTLGQPYAGATATGASYAIVRQLQGDLPVATLTKMSTLLTLWRQREEEMVRYLADLGNVTVHDVTGTAHTFKSARQLAQDLAALIAEIDSYNIAGISGQIAAAVAPKAESARQIAAGGGLTGGGSLVADRTLALGTPGAVSGTTTNSVTGSSHTHEVTKATTAEAQAGTGAGLMTPPLVATQIAAAVADQTTAESGANNSKLMTALRTFQQVTARLVTQALAEAGADNSMLMTALRTYQQVTARIATQAQAEGGTDALRLLTPQRGKQLIDAVLAATTAFVRTAGATMTGALTLAGNATTALHAVPKQQLDAAIAGLPVVRFSKEQDLGWHAITTAGALSLTHTLGVAPKLIRLQLKCIVANLNYSVGDIIEINAGGLDAGANYGVGVWSTASGVYLRFSTNTNVFYYQNKTTGGVSSLVNTAWQLGVVVWA